MWAVLHQRPICSVYAPILRRYAGMHVYKRHVKTVQRVLTNYSSSIYDHYLRIDATEYFTRLRTINRGYMKDRRFRYFRCIHAVYTYNIGDPSPANSG